MGGAGGAEDQGTVAVYDGTCVRSRFRTDLRCLERFGYGTILFTCTNGILTRY